MSEAAAGLGETIAATPARSRGWTARWRALPLSAQVGAAVVFFWVLVAAFGPLLAPHPVGAIVADGSFESISARNPLGSDYLGRDVLSRMLSGARYTVGLALAAAALASSLGATLALTATVGARWSDEAMSRLVDAFSSVPSKVLALVMVAAFGSSIPLLLTLATVIYVPGAYRIARSIAVGLYQLDYVQAARARGEGQFHIAWREILPNMLQPVLADFGLRFVFIVLLLSGLSFLGLGVQPPHADLGSLVRENTSGLADGAPAVILPAMAIATLTISVNLLIDGLSGAHRGGGAP